MPLFGLLEQEYRGNARGHIAAGMSLLIALFVQVARLRDAVPRRSAAVADRRSIRSNGCANSSPNISASIGRPSSTQASSA